MDQETRKSVIESLDDLTDRAEELMRSFDYLIERHQLWQDKSHEAQRVYSSCNLAHKLAGSIREANDNIKRVGANTYIRDTVIGWYRHLHYDIHPLVEIDESQVQDPDIESIKFVGVDTWEVIMTTPTHGKERVVIQSDGASWQQIYSADPC